MDNDTLLEAERKLFPVYKCRLVLEINGQENILEFELDPLEKVCSYEDGVLVEDKEMSIDYLSEMIVDRADDMVRKLIKIKSIKVWNG